MISEPQQYESSASVTINSVRAIRERKRAQAAQAQNRGSVSSERGFMDAGKTTDLSASFQQDLKVLKDGMTSLKNNEKTMKDEIATLKKSEKQLINRIMELEKVPQNEPPKGGALEHPQGISRNELDRMESNLDIIYKREADTNKALCSLEDDFEVFKRDVKADIKEYIGPIAIEYEEHGRSIAQRLGEVERQATVTTGKVAQCVMVGNQVPSMHSTNARWSSSITGLESSVASLKTSVADIERKIALNFNQHEKKFLDMNEKITEKGASLGADEVTEMKKTISTLGSSCAGFETLLKTAERKHIDDIKKHENKFLSLDDSIDQVQKQLHQVAISSKQATQSTEIRETDKRVDDLSKSVTRILSDVKQLPVLKEQVGKLYSLKDQVERSCASKDELQTLWPLKDEVKKLSSMKDQVENLSTMKDQVEKLSTLKTQVENLSMKIRVDNLSTMKNQVDKLSAMKDQVDKLSPMKDQVEKLSAMKDQVEKLSPLEDEVQRLSAKANEMKRLSDIRDGAKKSSPLKDEIIEQFASWKEETTNKVSSLEVDNKVFKDKQVKMIADLARQNENMTLLDQALEKLEKDTFDVNIKCRDTVQKVPKLATDMVKEEIELIVPKQVAAALKAQNSTLQQSSFNNAESLSTYDGKRFDLLHRSQQDTIVRIASVESALQRHSSQSEVRVADIESALQRLSTKSDARFADVESALQRVSSKSDVRIESMEQSQGNMIAQIANIVTTSETQAGTTQEISNRFTGIQRQLEDCKIMVEESQNSMRTSIQEVSNRSNTNYFGLKSLEHRYENMTTESIYQQMVHWMTQNYPQAPAFLDKLKTLQKEMERVTALQHAQSQYEAELAEIRHRQTEYQQRTADAEKIIKDLQSIPLDQVKEYCASLPQMYAEFWTVRKAFDHIIEKLPGPGFQITWVLDLSRPPSRPNTQPPTPHG